LTLGNTAATEPTMPLPSCVRHIVIRSTHLCLAWTSKAWAILHTISPKIVTIPHNRINFSQNFIAAERRPSEMVMLMIDR
jgi:hypothetical protein